jgi:hypothetical protein
MKSSQFVSACLALATGLSALCFESASALASPPTPPIPFAWTVDMRGGLSLDRAKGWDFRLPQTPLSGVNAIRFLSPTGPRASNPSFTMWSAGQGVVAKRSSSPRGGFATPSASSGSQAARMQPRSAALAVAALNGNPFDPTWPLYTMDPEAFAIAAPLMWATQQINQREARSPYAKYACDPGSSGGGSDGGCSGRPGAQRAASQGYMTDVTTGVGLGMLAGWLVPKALKQTFGGRQRADLKSDVKAERDASKVSALKLTIPDFIVYPSVTFGSSGNLDGFGCSARGVF